MSAATEPALEELLTIEFPRACERCGAECTVRSTLPAIHLAQGLYVACPRCGRVERVQLDAEDEPAIEGGTVRWRSQPVEVVFEPPMPALRLVESPGDASA